MLKGEHSEKMNAMKKLVEQQLRDEHAGVLESHSAAHAARAQEIEEMLREEMKSHRDSIEKLLEMESIMKRNQDDGERRLEELHVERFFRQDECDEKLIEQQLRDEQSTIESHSAAHAERARSEILREEMKSHRDSHSEIV